MDTPKLPWFSHRDDPILWDYNQDTTSVMAGQRLESTNRRDGMIGQPQFRTNFSYPRPEVQVSKHESVDSRSSLNSAGSMPSMTDASDSEVSVDDDYQYNTSASELWDSFWPARVVRQPPIQKSQSSSVLQSHTSDFFTIDYYTSKAAEAEDDAVTITGQDVQESMSTQWPLPRSSPSRQKTAKAPVTYSVYPKPSPIPPRLTILPPRTSSLTPESSLTAKRRLKGSKSIANLKPSRSNVSLYSALGLSPTSPSFGGQQTQSMPVSPIDTAPKLRPSASAHNIRGLALPTSAAPPVPELPNMPGLQHSCPPLDRIVSVFELDSDNERDGDSNGFAKRLARGLQHKKSSRDINHKKSASEKRSSGDKKAPEVQVGSDGTQSLGRKRGGSLGRILGLKSK
ncbi:hypothetical protein JX265_013261 [Neoarthrinium moseri]|uniref:Uncharacterized protein n=1 Tax=Neoarthrinium moseri TaxID=1658444 RepID=A0A9P9W961_9PEZI|nr:uncharacterized protein JN550_003256 [Neoarthrinium moseri]KAI1851143.1 hypothetical protein JX265_013261 [Neoarthrinium moseri]KAI1873987.1 hypothetical protein JN550_003256 [Neoarthrinium moseri]